MGSLGAHDGLEGIRYRMRGKLLAIGDVASAISSVQTAGARRLSRMDSR